jgi:phosphoglycerate dehydrogenase-like enzyme
MASRRIVVCYPVEDRHLAQIQAAAGEAEIINAGQERIANELTSADWFLGHAKVPVPWPEVVRSGRLKWIQSSAAGLDHCLTPEVIASDIEVTSASGLFADQVAEQTFALLLGLLRGIPTFFRQQQRKEFVRRPTGDLHGATVGIIGFGGNGRRIAQILAPYGVRILATDWWSVPDKPSDVESVWSADRLHEILPQADVLILAMPLNKHTLGMFGAREFALMKKGCTFINVARGQVVQEPALVEALQKGNLAGAGLDVTEVEPLPESSPLWNMPNVLITPHVGAQSARRADDTTDLICENIRRKLSGQPLLNRVDKQLGFPERAAEPWIPQRRRR